jgi:hypothetical protein
MGIELKKLISLSRGEEGACLRGFVQVLRPSFWGLENLNRSGLPSVSI